MVPQHRTRLPMRRISRAVGLDCSVIDGAYTSVPESSQRRSSTLFACVFAVCVADLSATLLVNLSVTASAPKPCALRRRSSDCRQSHLIAVQIFNERSFHLPIFSWGCPNLKSSFRPGHGENERAERTCSELPSWTAHRWCVLGRWRLRGSNP